MNITSLEDICQTFARTYDVTVTCFREANSDMYGIRMAVGNRIIKQEISGCYLASNKDVTPYIMTSLEKMYTMLTGEIRNAQYGGLVCSNPSANVKINQLTGGLNVIEYSGDRPEFIPIKLPEKTIKKCSYCQTIDSFNKHLCTQCGAPEE